MVVKKIMVALVLVLVYLAAAGQPPLAHEQMAAGGLTYVYRGSYDSAHLAWQSLESNTPLRSLLEAFLLRWKHIPINRYADGERYTNTLTDVAASLAKTEGDLYLRIVAEMLLAEYHYTTGETMQALWHARKAYPLLVKVLDQKTTEPELLFVKGMYLYYMDFFREKGFIYKTALLPFRNGNQKEGLDLLRAVAETESMASTEAAIYLAHIYLHHQGRAEEALPFSKKLAEAYPKNLKLRELLIENLLVLRQYQSAAGFINQQLLTSMAYFKIPALYFKGFLEHESGNVVTANKMLRQCVDLAKSEDLESAFSEKADALLRQLKL
jgi:tetratricopeptide (TPR) repeat protein